MNRKQQLAHIFSLLRQLIFSARPGITELIADTNFRPQHFWALRTLAKEQKPINAKDLAERLSISPGAVTQIIDPLVANGFVLRKIDPQNRRAIQLTLSAKAQKTINKLTRAHHDHLQILFQDLNDTDIAELTRILEKIHFKPSDDDSCGH